MVLIHATKIINLISPSLSVLSHRCNSSQKLEGGSFDPKKLKLTLGGSDARVSTSHVGGEAGGTVSAWVEVGRGRGWDGGGRGRERGRGEAWKGF